MRRFDVTCAVWVAVLALVGCQSETARSFEQAARELPAAEAEAKRLGLVLDGSALKPNPPVTPEENAAPALREAFGKLTALSRSRRGWAEEIDKALKDPTGAAVGPAREILAELAPAMADAARATQRPRVDFGRDWESPKPWTIRFPEFSSFKQLVRALSLRATLGALEGDTAAAIEDFRTAQALSRFVGSEPVVIGAFVRVVCDLALLRQMEWALATRPEDAAFHRSLADLAAKQATPPLDFAWYLRSETLFSTAVIEAGIDEIMDGSLSFDQDPPEPDELAGHRRRVLPFGVGRDTARKAYRARSLQMWSEVFSDREAVSDPRLFAPHLKRVVGVFTREGDPTLEINRFLMPVFGQMGDAFLRHQALVGSFRGLMAAVEFKHAKGRFPKTLAEAGFQATDPYSGGPYQLRVDGDIVRVSNGQPDGIAADGRGEDSEWNRRNFEFVFPKTADATGRTAPRPN